MARHVGSLFSGVAPFPIPFPIQEATHEMATRFCFLDYDREIAIVAEAIRGNRSELIAVGRLVTDADHQKAEFALLVEDRWQNRGLGTAIAKHCMPLRGRGVFSS